jgi:lauroyl/myristoyl acyltransferase
MSAEEIASPNPWAGSTSEQTELSAITRLKFMVVRGFLYAWARCFSLSGLYLFGQFFGTCEWLLKYNGRRRFRQRLEQIYGKSLDDRDRSFVRRASWRHFTRIRCDKLFYLIFDKLPKEKILKRIKFHDRHIVDAALAHNKGVYACLSHYGSHHVLVLLAALLGYKCAGVRDRNEGALRRYVQEKYEETFPEFRSMRMFFADTYPRDIYRCFQEGYIVATALDVSRDRGSHLRTASVDMFGQKREFLTGTMQIALRCGAPVLQGFVISRKNFYFRIVVKGPLVDPASPPNDAATLQAAMQQYADNIAAHVLEYPCHIAKI